MEGQLEELKSNMKQVESQIASLEGQLEELKSNIKQVEEKDAVAAIKQQMQQHAKADEEIARKDSVISALTAKLKGESSCKIL